MGQYDDFTNPEDPFFSTPLWCYGTPGELTLNAGCGNNYWGDIRIDTDPEAKARNMHMDICNLLFPPMVFKETRCISVLEHIPDWKLALKELMRVTNDLLIIEVPVNSNILATDLFRLLIPTPKNIRLWRTRKQRAKETFHQFRPEQIAQEITTNRIDRFSVMWGKKYTIYHQYPSRSWKFDAFRNVIP